MPNLRSSLGTAYTPLPNLDMHCEGFKSHNCKHLISCGTNKADLGYLVISIWYSPLMVTIQNGYQVQAGTDYNF